jgi:hypothetical protein
MECSAHNQGGNNSAGFQRVLEWTGAGVLAGLLAGILAGFAGWALLLATVAGASVGLFVGQAIAWFGRLKEQTTRTITMAGIVKCAGRNSFGFQPVSDGDWTCNLGELKFMLPLDLQVTAPGAGDQVDEVRLRAAPGSNLVHAFPSFNDEAHTVPTLHCEITAHAGDYAVVGGAVGSVAGLVAGIAIGLAICAAAGIFTFGIGAALCALIVAILAAVGAFAGGVVGDAVGAFIGWVVDELSDFDKLGKTIESHFNCTIIITGRWVTDISHEHNEIHDIEAVQITDCDWPKLHPVTGVVGIGRAPAGGDHGQDIK